MIRRRSAVSARILILYALAAPMGSLVRFGGQESAFGSTTVLLLSAVLLSLDTAVTTIRRVRVFQTMFLLIVWMIAASAFAPVRTEALISGGSLLIYLLAAALAYYAFSTDQRPLWLLAAYCMGGLLSAFATVVDFAGLVDLPGVNEAVIATRVEFGSVAQASGVFPRRSGMAAYYTFSIAIGLILGIAYRGRLKLLRAIFLGSALTCLVALGLTHNRAGVLGTVAAALLVLGATARTPRRMLKTLATVAIAGLLVAWGVTRWFPGTWAAYQAQLGISANASGNPAVGESDQLRVVILQHVARSLVANPVGHGYSLIPDVPGYDDVLWDPHNILAQVVWGGGLFGLAWLLVYGIKGWRLSAGVIRRAALGAPHDQLAVAVLGGLLAFFLVGMAHTIINTGFAWLLFGILVRAVSDAERLRAEARGRKGPQITARAVAPTADNRRLHASPITGKTGRN